MEGAGKTLILARGPLTGGTALTARVAAQLGRPCLAVDLDKVRLAPVRRGALPLPAVVEGPDVVVGRIAAWLEAMPGTVLNVAGPRASEDGEIYALARQVLEAVLGGAVPG